MKKFFSLVSAIAFFAIPSVAFADFSDVPRTHENYDAIVYVQNEGIVQGFPDGKYKPNDKITRAAFLKIIIEARFKDEEINECLAKNLVGTWKYVFFPDVPKDVWYDKYICVGKVEEIIQGDKDGNFRPADNISIVEASKVIAKAFRYDINGNNLIPWYRSYIDSLSDRKAIPMSITSFDYKITRGEMAEMIHRLLAKIDTKPTQTFFSLASEE